MGMMTKDTKNQDQKPQTPPANAQDNGREDRQSPNEKGGPKDPVERGGPKGPEPTRFGDWESGGRCTDF